ncbi:hypothetical protein [Nocardia sp. CA-120079]|uniref:hypothetical protein n=1 Tax=Nocardia sp. CA-120079 TaxID=3239974 RepID=UPI003D96424E
MAVHRALEQRDLGASGDDVDPGAGDLLAAGDRVRKAGARPPLSAVAVACGSTRPISASISLVSQARLKR